MQSPNFKILVDNNLSVLIKEVLKVNFPNSRHVSELQISGASDSDIWQYAKEKDYIILTKDKDFYHRISVFGPPPKIVWITKGNCKTRKCCNC